MIGVDFSFNNHKLSDFGLKMYDPEEEQSFVSRSYLATEISTNRPVQTVYGSIYDDTLSLHFLIAKDPDKYDTQFLRKFMKRDMRRVRSWLESPSTPCELRMTSRPEDRDGEETSYFGIFADVQPFLVNQECYGFYLTFKCNSPYGFSPERVDTYDLGAGTTLKKNLNNDTDDTESYIYPVIKVYLKSSVSNKGQLLITNHTDSKHIMKLNIPNTEYFEINCKNKMVTLPNGHSLSLSELGWAINDAFDLLSNYKLYWLRLLPGMNDIEVASPTGAVSKVEIVSRRVRKADGF